MDSKKVYKKLSTCFWFFLATMPIIIPLIQMIVQTFVHLDSINNINDVQNYINGVNFYNQLDEFITNLGLLLPNFILNPFENLFNTMGVIGYQALGFICAWFVWAYVIELLVDFVVWLPKLIHSFMERWN